MLVSGKLGLGLAGCFNKHLLIEEVSQTDISWLLEPLKAGNPNSSITGVLNPLGIALYAGLEKLSAVLAVSYLVLEWGYF